MKRSARVAFSGLLVCAAAALAQTQQYVISTYAGGAPPPTPARAVDVSIGYATGVTADAAGNVYFASSDLNCVFKVDPGGVLTRVAGNSKPGFSGDGGPATSAQLQGPGSVASDRSGNLFIADFGNLRIRRVSLSGIITTVAGNGARGSSGDGGPATSAPLAAVGIAVDNVGNLFIASYDRVRKVSPSGIITTVSGNVSINGALGVAVDSLGALFIADHSGIHKVSASGVITNVAVGAALSVALDSAGNLLYVEYPSRVRKVSPDGVITIFAGNGTFGFSGDGGPATSAQLYNPDGVAVDGDGNVFIVGPVAVRKVSPDGIITKVAGNGWGYFSGDGLPATSAQLNDPSGVVVDGAGNLYIADRGNGRIRKVSPSGIITTVAGNGTHGFSGDDGPATSAQLDSPDGLAADKMGNLFIADSGRIRRVSPIGIITTMAGGGTSLGDGGPAQGAQLGGNGVAVDQAGNLFFTDANSNRVRKVSPDGIITTLAGSGLRGFSGDGGPALEAQFDSPYSIAVDAAGNLYIGDYNNRRVRRVSTDGIITTVAGNGIAGFSGDGGIASSAELYSPSGLAVDGIGNLFIADYNNYRVRKVTPGGIITTVAGDGAWGNDTCCFAGEDGPATGAALTNPTAVAVDAAGNVYVADAGDFDDGIDTFSSVRILCPANQSVLVTAVLDAASQRADQISPGKIVVVRGAGIGPLQPIQNQASNGQFSKELGGTTVSFNGIRAPILYASATQVAAIVPYMVTGTTAQVTIAYQGETSAAFSVPVALAAPSLFTMNQTGAGQAAAINALDGTINTAANAVKVGEYISLYSTGEGQSAPDGVDGRLGGSIPTHPVLPVIVRVGGIRALVQYAGGVTGQVAGLMQVNVQIPDGVQPGGYVPVELQVGDRSSGPGVWIAVAGN